MASCRPWAFARWVSRWASNVFAGCTRSKLNSSPSAAAMAASCAWRARASSTGIPYLADRCSAALTSRDAGAPGSSSNERQTTSTSWSKPASAASKRRLPT